MHFILAYVDETYGYFLIGGTDNGNCFQFKDGTITPKANMSIQRSFMSVISYDQLIFAVGGYDFAEKNQTGSIEIYEVQTNEWKTGILKDLIVPRSQAGALLMNSTSIYVFGGYSKSLGTLNSIEHISIETKENKLIELVLPIPLRRFGLFPISENKAILLGGESKNSQKIDKTFIVDLNEKNVVHLVPLSDNLQLVYGIDFLQKTDQSLARVFLQELKEAKNHVKNCIAGNVYVELAEVPKNIMDIDNPQNYSNGLVVFNLFVNKFDTIKKFLNYFVTFREYIQFHIHSIKTFLHIRMNRKGKELMNKLEGCKIIPENYIRHLESVQFYTNWNKKEENQKIFTDEVKKINV